MKLYIRVVPDVAKLLKNKIFKEVRKCYENYKTEWRHCSVYPTEIIVWHLY